MEKGTSRLLLELRGERARLGRCFCGHSHPPLQESANITEHPRAPIVHLTPPSHSSPHSSPLPLQIYQRILDSDLAGACVYGETVMLRGVWMATDYGKGVMASAAV